MNVTECKAIIEGLLFASGDEGITIKQLSLILDDSDLSFKDLLANLKTEYNRECSGIMLVQTNEVYHLTTKPEHSHFYKKMLESPHRTKLSQAALETLAIIAYIQPVTRLEIEEIRGVNSDRSVQTLQARALVEEIGRKDTIGRPLLFGTTKEFLFYFGLTSLSELPPLPESVDEEELEHEADLFFERMSQLEKEQDSKKSNKS